MTPVMTLKYTLAKAIPKIDTNNSHYCKSKKLCQQMLRIISSKKRSIDFVIVPILGLREHIPNSNKISERFAVRIK